MPAKSVKPSRRQVLNQRLDAIELLIKEERAKRRTAHPSVKSDYTDSIRALTVYKAEAQQELDEIPSDR